MSSNPASPPSSGPNGAGKTTLLRQIKEFAEREGIAVWKYSNLLDGGAWAKEKYAQANDFASLAAAITGSEGECVAMNFSNSVGKLGQAVRNAVGAGKPLVVLLDAIDSGASVDRARDLRDLRAFLDMVHEADISTGAEIYIVMAVNDYELAKAPADCVDVRNGEHMDFKTYDEYADFICSYTKRHARKPGRPRKTADPGEKRPDGTRNLDLMPRD